MSIFTAASYSGLVAGFRVLVMLSDMLTWPGYMLTKISGGVGGKQDAQ